VVFRQDDPERASQLLQVLSPFPCYKAGQFLFDLLEWEDFMLDGPEPPIEPGFYLYQDVVLGVVDSALVLMAAGEAGETKSSGDSG
jgi:hypothetical protein